MARAIFRARLSFSARVAREAGLAYANASNTVAVSAAVGRRRADKVTAIYSAEAVLTHAARFVTDAVSVAAAPKRSVVAPTVVTWSRLTPKASAHVACRGASQAGAARLERAPRESSPGQSSRSRVVLPA